MQKEQTKRVPEHEHVPLLAYDKADTLPLATQRDGQLSNVDRVRARYLQWKMLPLFLIAFGSCLFLVKHTLFEPASTRKNVDVCLTPGCVLASAELLRSRSPNYMNIDPCDNFEAYMCEGWDATHDLRPDQSSIGTLSVGAERAQTLLRHLLEAPLKKVATAKPSIDEENFEKLQGAYEACLNESLIASKGSGPLIKVIQSVQETLGSVSHKSLTDTYIMLMGLGIQPLFSLGISADEKDPDVNVLVLNPPDSIGLPVKQYYEDQDLLQKYSKMIEEVDQGLKRDSDSSRSFLVGHPFSELVDFEAKLAAALPETEERQDVQYYYNPRTLDNVTASFPHMDISTLINNRNSHFEPRKIIVGSPSYLANLSSILEGTEPNVLEGYISWKVIQTFASYIEADAVRPLKRFNNALAGKPEDAKPERWQTCLRHVDNGLGWILSKFFIEKAFSEEAKNYGDQVILDIKAEFIRKLDASTWMSKDVRELAKNKVHNIVQKIGYPTASPNIRNSTELGEYYKHVEVSPNDYFNNAVSMRRNDVDSEWEKATKPVDRNEWGMTATTVNAYYNPPGNEIVFPAAIMQSPIFYPPDIPSYLTYGAFGAVAGHELSHAFDSSGRNYDEHGNYTDWWNKETIAAFKTRTECFVKEYANYTITGPDGKPYHLNGRLTLGENIADAGGLSAAFHAWKAREAQSKKKTQLLPGLQEYTPEQLFFLNFGTVWCGKTRPADMLRRLYSDPHSPTAARISLTVANSEEFRETFKCKTKEATCKLW